VNTSSDEDTPKGDLQYSVSSVSRRDDVEFNELNIRLKISYKTLVFAFVLFDVLRKIIDVLPVSDWYHDL